MCGNHRNLTQVQPCHVRPVSLHRTWSPFTAPHQPFLSGLTQTLAPHSLATRPASLCLDRPTILPQGLCGCCSCCLAFSSVHSLASSGHGSLVKVTSPTTPSEGHCSSLYPALLFSALTVFGAFPSSPSLRRKAPESQIWHTVGAQEPGTQ